MVTNITLFEVTQLKKAGYRESDIASHFHVTKKELRRRLNELKSQEQERTKEDI